MSAEELGDSEPAGGTNPAPLASIAALISAICSGCIFPPQGTTGQRRRGRSKAGRRRQGISSTFFVRPQDKGPAGPGLLPGVTPPGDWAQREGGAGGPCLPRAGWGGASWGRGGGTAGGGAAPSLAPRTPAGGPGRAAPPTAYATSREAQEAAPGRWADRQTCRPGPCPAQLSTAWGPPPEGPGGRGPPAAKDAFRASTD